MRPRSKTIQADTIDQYVKEATRQTEHRPRRSDESVKAKHYFRSLQKTIKLFKAGVTNNLASIPEDEEINSNPFFSMEEESTLPFSFEEAPNAAIVSEEIGSSMRVKCEESDT